MSGGKQMPEEWIEDSRPPVRVRYFTGTTIEIPDWFYGCFPMLMGEADTL